MRRLFTFLIMAGVFVCAAALTQAAEQNRQRLLMDFGWQFTLGDPTNAVTGPLFSSQGLC